MLDLRIAGIRRGYVLPALLAAVTGFANSSQDASARINGLPLRFEENRGQAEHPSRFIARGPAYEVEVRAAETRLTLSDGQSRAASIRTVFIGANREARVQPEQPLLSHTNYFIGNSSRGWHTEIPNFGRVRIEQVYPGIDLIFYGKGGALEYDFVINPGADPSRIQFETKGADAARLSLDGDLVLHAGRGEVRWRKPVIYQDVQERRNKIDGGFRVSGRRVHFQLGNYDRTHPLVIDPTLAYATYFGGQQSFGFGFERARGIGVDAAGNVYIAGITASADLPVTSGAAQTTFGGYTANLRYVVGDAFVAKFTPGGALSYVTYLGGKGDDAAFALAVDSAGNAYVTGMTNSADFPVTAGVLQSQLKGAGGNACVTFGDAFLTKLDPTGAKLLYSTYLGGSRDDFGAAVALDPQGNAYIAGATLSIDFPIANGVQKTFSGGGGEPGRPSCNGAPLFDGGDAFVAKINPSASSVIFSTYLGGRQDDVATSIAVDSGLNVYVGGFTLSSDFPSTAGAFQTTFHGVDQSSPYFHTGDGFVAKLNNSGSSLVYATYLGGSGDDAVFGIAIDAAGTVYATGATSSQNFPVTSTAVQRSFRGYLSLPFVIEYNLGDAFITRLDAQGANLLYSTYLGGSQNDAGMAIAVDGSGLIYLSGMTDSTDFPVTKDAVQPAFGGDDTSVRANYFPLGDGFFAIVDPNVATPLYSTYYGGQFNDALAGFALDAKGNAWMTGWTESPNLKVTTNAVQQSYTGGAAGNGGPAPDAPIEGQAMLVKFSVNDVVGSGPAITSVLNAAGETPAIAQNTWIEIKGTNLAPHTRQWQTSDFVNGQMPQQLDGVSVTVNGKPGFVYYISSSQVNILTPIDATTGPVQVKLTNGQSSSAPFSVPMQTYAPGFFQFGAGPYVAATHADGSYVGPTSLYPGLSQPAQPNETIVLYANGWGQTTPAVANGSASPVGTLAITPTLTIAGAPAQISFAGINGLPGVYQFNVTVPANLPDGDAPVVANFNNLSTQTGVMLSVHQ